MKKKKFIQTVLLFVMLPLASCEGDPSIYSGDGYLTDKGWAAATDRYILDLGPIILKKRSRKTYQLQNMPVANFVVGLELQVSSEDHNIIEEQIVRPTIFMELSGPGGIILFKDQSSLDSWTWSVKAKGNRVFIYRHDQPATFFTPAAKTKYDLKVGVINPDATDLNYSARLILKSGGWK